MTLLIAPQLMGPLGQYGIKHAALFDGGTGNLTRTPASAGDRQAWTLSLWYQRWKFDGSEQVFFSSYQNASNRADFRHGYLGVEDVSYSENTGSGSAYYNTDAVFRDTTGFMHIVHVWDSANATAGDRQRLYINGVRVTALSGVTDPTLNLLSTTNNAVAHALGYHQGFSARYCKCYMAEVQFIDGQALDPSYFGETDAATSQWKAKRYAGAYGANGFYLDFSNPANLGEDQSGNGNDWTVGGSVSQVTSTPTNVYATLSPLRTSLFSSTFITYSLGNTRGNFAHATVYGYGASTLIFDISDCDFYAEFIFNKAATSTAGVGVRPANNVDTQGATAAGQYIYQSDGNKDVSSSISAYGASWTTNVIGIHVNNGTVTLYKDGVSQGAIATGLTGQYEIIARTYNYSAPVYVDARFEEASWTQAPPTGSKSLCTDNLPSRSPKVPSTPETGSFAGNANADGPFINLGMAPDQSGASTINGNAITWGTHADACATGFKLRTSSASYNASGANTYSIAVAAYAGGRNIPPATAQ